MGEYKRVKRLGIFIIAIFIAASVTWFVITYIADTDEHITCEDGEYDLIMLNGSHGGCVLPTFTWNRSTPQTTNPLYINGTEITRLERIGDTANFTINYNLTLVYWEILPHVIYDNEVQRYAIEYINTTTCDRNVMIGDRECVATTSQKYHIFIRQGAYDDFNFASSYMEHEDTIYIDMTKR